MEVTFLTAEQIEGRNALEVMKRYGVRAGMSDLAIVLGGFMGFDATSDGQCAGLVWSASPGGGGRVRTIFPNGHEVTDSPDTRTIGARPALPLSATSKLEPREARDIGDVRVVEYGEYPQTVAPVNVARELEKAFSAGRLETTGKKYTFDDEAVYSANPFQAKEHTEYLHKGKRYIRVESKQIDPLCFLSNESKPIAGENFWIEVQPVEWLVDPTGLWVARQALFSGVPFDKNQHYEGKFSNTEMQQYLDKYFVKEMQASLKIEQQAAKADASALAELPTAEKSGAAEKPVKKYGAEVKTAAQRLANQRNARSMRGRMTSLPPEDWGR